MTKNNNLDRIQKPPNKHKQTKILLNVWLAPNFNGNRAAIKMLSSGLRLIFSLIATNDIAAAPQKIS